jgi:filamentous hemagglutinin family protein
LFLSSSPVFAGPEGGVVSAGEGAIATPDVNTTNINQYTQNLVIDWQTFNLTQQEVVQFFQPSSTASALNRIHDQSPSQIFGSIIANGNVALLNANGILFGPTAHVNVNALVASSLDITNDDFMAGKYLFQAPPGQDGGMVVNQGVIHAATGGSVTLMGGAVSNEGVILAHAGQVNLVAGNQITMDFDGDGLMQFAINKEVLSNAQALDAAVNNSGVIEADGGAVLLKGSAAADVFTHVVNNTGVIKAGRIENQGGTIRLVASGAGASVINTGTLNANAADGTSDGGTIEITGANVTQAGTVSADSSGGQGGTINIQSSDTTLVSGNSVTTATSESGQGGTVHVLGDRVGILDMSVIDVSGALGGGEVLIGGDRHGDNPDIQNASRTYVAKGADIKADATVNGDGGKVIVWADEFTQYYGNIFTRGGAEGGNGGFIEVSGKNLLDFNGLTNTSAPQGSAGTLLLDPTNINIQATNTDDAQIADGSIVFADSCAAATCELTAAAVEAQTGNIVLQATSDITVNSNLDLVLQTTGMRVVFQAGDSISINSSVTTNGAAIWFEADSPHSTSGAANGTGTLTIGANVASNGGGSTGGNITLMAGTGNFTISANVDAGAGNINLTTSDQGAISLITDITQNGLDRLRSTGTVTIGQGTTAGSDGLGTGALTRTASDITNDGNTSISSSTGTFTFALIATNNITLTSNDNLTTHQKTLITADSDASGAGTFTLTNANSDLVTTTHDLTVTAADVVIGGDGIDVGTATATIQTSKTGTQIDLGTNTGGSLSLTDTELDNIHAGTLIIGDSNAGAITVSADVTTGATTLHLKTNDKVTATAGGIIETNLAITAGDTVKFEDPDTDVDLLAISVNDKDATFTDTDGFEIAIVDGVTGIQIGGGTLHLDAGAAVTQSAKIIAAELELEGASGSYTLTNTSNDVNKISGNTGTISFTDTDDFAVKVITSSGDVTLTSMNGKITDDNGGAANIVATSLSATAKTGIDLDTTITTLTLASVTGTGDIDISDTAGGLAVTSATTNDGTITLNATGGNLAITTVTAAGAGADVTLTTTTSGDITLGAVTAPDVVTLNAAGAITDTNAGAANVLAASLSATAATGINTDTTITTLTLASVTGTGDIDISDTAGGLAVTSATTNDGTITLNATGGNLAITTVTAAGAGADVTLTTTTSGDITLGAVTAPDVVTLNAAGAITDTNAGAANVLAASLSATAATGINTDTTITTLTLASVTGTGDIDISDTAGGLAVTSATTNDGTITLNATGGNLAITTVTAGDEGDVFLTTTTSGDITATGTINTNGADGGANEPGSDAGDITLTAAGAIDISAATITATGGNAGADNTDSTLGLAGGDGGTVTITASNGAVTLGDIDTSGGNASGFSPSADADPDDAPGGNAGNITVTSNGASAAINFGAGTVFTTTGGTPAPEGGANGTNGIITLDSDKDITIDANITGDLSLLWGQGIAGGTLTINATVVDSTPLVTATGGTGNDTVQFTNAGALTGIIFGGAGNDTLIGDANGNTFTITGPNSGTLGNITGFWIGIENLTGGAGVDTFSFVGDGTAPDGSLTGIIDGKAGTLDELSYASYSPAVVVTMTDKGSIDGVQGTATATGGFDNIDIITGNGSTASTIGSSISTSLSPTTWTLNGGTTTYNIGGNIIPFSGFLGGIVSNNTDTGSTLGDVFDVPAVNNLPIRIDGAATWYAYPDILLSTSSVSGSDNGVLQVPVDGSGAFANPLDGSGGLTIGTGGLALVTASSFPFIDFTGHLIIGGSVTTLADAHSMADVTTVAINTTTMTIDPVYSGFYGVISGGNVTLIANDININGSIYAGPGSGTGELVILAVDPVIQGNGSITSSPVILVANSGILFTDGPLTNSENIFLFFSLFGGSGTIEVAANNTGPISFAPGSFANPASSPSPTMLNLMALFPWAVAAQVSLPTISQLLILQELGYIDTGLFEQDLSLFSIIGNGIALWLAQCEEIEGCAPNVTEEELNYLIGQLTARIAELQKLQEEGANEAFSDQIVIGNEKVTKLIELYDNALKLFLAYREELHKYLSGGQEEEQPAPDESGVEGAAPGASIETLAKMLEGIKARITWLESLKSDPEARLKLSKKSGISLTEEALDTLIEGAKAEAQSIEQQIKLLQEGGGTQTSVQDVPQFVAETGDYSRIDNVNYGPSLLDLTQSVAMDTRLY